MEDSLSTNNLVRVVVSVLLAVILVGVVMMPIISDMAEDKEVTNTLTNTGSPFALANADSESHPIIMSVDGDKLIVTSDGSPVSTGLGNVLPSVWTPYDDTDVGPFNTYYVALNLADGDNADDEYEERLSKVKGEIAYYLDADNLRLTANGYEFTPTLYNVMLVIPPVYWYSELDAPTTENPTPTTGKLYMASSPDAFESMGISASNMKDYAHTYTDRSDTANPVVGHSPAIMIGYYWGHYENGQYISQSDKGTSVSGSLATITTNLAKSNNGVTYGVYENENFSQWTLFKMMGWTVMGTMDSKSMMGNPISLGSTVLSGSVATAYHKAENGGSNALFIEDPYGLTTSRFGDIAFANRSSPINAGNTLGGTSNSADVVNTLDTQLYFPNQDGPITEIYSESDVFGFPKAVGTSSNSLMNERVYFQSGSPCVLGSTNPSISSNNAGLGTASVTGWQYNTGTFGLRFTYVVTDSSFTVPDGADKDYAYIMSYNTNGSIQNVQSIEDDVATSYMPTGTTLNSYWNFKDGYYTFPELSDATESVDIAVGSDSILQFYNSGNVVLQTATGTVDLGRVNDVTPTPVTVTVQNGVMTYTKADSTTDTATVLLYKANEGDYVYGQNVKLLNDLSQGNVYVGQYQYGVTTANGTKDIGAIGTFTSQTETVGEGEDATEVTTVVPDVALFNTANVSTSTVTSSITQGQYYATINSISIATEFSDSDSVDYTVTGFYAPKTQTYVTIEQGGGLAYDILLYLPVLILVSVISFIGYATLRPDSEFVRSLKSRF